ncbi:MAG: hypothetical protein GXP62_16710 [Oligoflexia bacterium]|nr:hypothetical protein [Oligoflexia bacterium]
MRTSLSYALAAGALEPGVAVTRARTRPGVATRLDHAAAMLGDDLDSTPSGPWVVGDVGRISLGAMHLDAGPWRPGDRLPVVLDEQLAARARLEITVHTRRGAAVLSPVQGTFVRVEQLRRLAQGGWALDLVLDDVPGLHRVEVVVLGPDDDSVLARAELAVRVVV